MIILIIIGIILMISSAVSYAYEIHGIDIFAAIFGTFLICVGVIYNDIDDNPTALDVYRNKTTLEITYRDSIPIDSVVVFK